MRKIRAIILAAGKGTRMYPLTIATPKVLLPIAGIPMLHWTLRWLRDYDIDDIAINLHHCGEKIENNLGDGSRFGVTVHYFRESRLLGTALGAKRMSGNFGNILAVVYGDVLADFNLSDMIDFHIRRHAIATLALFNRLGRVDVGAVELGPDDRLLSFVERPSAEHTAYPYANGGVYVVSRPIFGYISDVDFSDFGHDVLPRLVRMGLPVYGYKLSEPDYLLDIGTPARYARANEDAIRGRVKTSATGIVCSLK